MIFTREDIFEFSKLKKEDLEFLPKSHSEAQKIKSKYYYKDKKCINGHNFIDYTNGGCALCYFDRYYKNDEKKKITRLENLKKIILIFIEFEIKKDKKFSEELLKFPASVNEAIKRKTNLVFERKPCISKGHFSERFIVKNNRKKSGEYKTFCVKCSENWAKENPEAILESGRRSTEKYREKYNRANKLRRRTDEFRAKRNKQRRERYKIDVNYRIEQRLRARVKKLLQGLNKSKSTKELVGCDTNFLKKYLEKKFKKGMTWDNYELWHIDHVRPCSLFDLTDPEEQKKCFNFKNLQPLWAGENISKGGTNRIFYRDQSKKLKN